MAHYVAENPADLTKHRANLAVDPDFPKPLLQAGSTGSNLIASMKVRGGWMGQRGQSVDRRVDRRIVAMLFTLAMIPLARAGDDALERPIVARAPLEIPHTLNLVLADLAKKRNRKPGNIESHAFLDLTPGLNPAGLAEVQRHARAHSHTRNRRARRSSGGSPKTCTAARRKTAGASRSIPAKANTSSSIASTRINGAFADLLAKRGGSAFPVCALLHFLTRREIHFPIQRSARATARRVPAAIGRRPRSALDRSTSCRGYRAQPHACR